MSDNNPNPDDLFCPGCGANIEHNIGFEMDEEVYTHDSVTLYMMNCCHAIVQDGEFLNAAEAREAFHE